MDNQQWIAPEFYNLTSEMESHAPEKIALKWLNEQGDYEEITYGELRKQANRLVGGLASLGCNKGIVFLLWFHAASSLMSSI